MATKRQVIGLADKLFNAASGKVRQLTNDNRNFNYKYTDLLFEVRLAWEEAAKYVLKNYEPIKKQKK